MSPAVKRFLSLMLVVVFVLSVMAIPASAVSFSKKTTVTGRFNGNKYSEAHHIYTNGSAAKLRICTFNQVGNRTSGQIRVKAVSDNGAVYIWTVKGCNGLLNSTTNITLPAGNTHYRVYIQRASTSNSNITATFYFSIDYMKNCWHY